MGDRRLLSNIMLARVDGRPPQPNNTDVSDVPIWSTNLKLKLITTIVAGPYGGFCNTHECVIMHCWCSVCVHSTTEVEDL